MPLYEQKAKGEYVYTLDSEEIYRDAIGKWPPAIPVIKAIRDHTNLGLKEAKDIWDARRKCAPPDEVAKLRSAAPKLAEALQPFAKFAVKWAEKPLKGLSNDLYSIHGGKDEPFGATIRLTDCIAAADALRAAGIEVQP